jgi:hypothetical protein
MFLVMRTNTLSHCAKKVKWQVESRGFQRREDAEGWRDFCQKEYKEETPKGRHKFFVIETEDFPYPASKWVKKT